MLNRKKILIPQKTLVYHLFHFLKALDLIQLSDFFLS